MNIYYRFDQDLQRIVLTSETTIQNQIRPIFKVLTVNPNLKKVVYQTGWTLGEQDVALFENNVEMWSFLRDLEANKGEEVLIDELNKQPEIQALIDQHYAPLTLETLNNVELTAEAKNAVLNILNRTKFLRLDAIVHYLEPTKYTVSIKWFMEGQKFLSFSTTANLKGEFDQIYPTRSQSLDIDAEDLEANPSKYFDWLWQECNEQELKHNKAACLWLMANMPEFFMIRSDNRIFMN